MSGVLGGIRPGVRQEPDGRAAPPVYVLMCASHHSKPALLFIHNARMHARMPS